MSSSQRQQVHCHYGEVATCPLFRGFSGPPSNVPSAGPVTSVSYSMDGNCVLVSTLDHTLRLLDKESGEMLNQ